MSNNNSAAAFGSGIALGAILTCSVFAGIAAVSGQKPFGDTPTPSPTVQSLTVPPGAVLSPVEREPFTTTTPTTSAQHQAHSIPGDTNPFNVPCAQEGDNGCYWNAATMGNGSGKSYVVTQDGDVYYLDEEMSK